MAKNKLSYININLFKYHKKFWDRFLNWVLNIGRIIIMLTQIVALSVFIYRFSLDRQLIDLKDKIKQKESIVKFLKNNENKYRNLQERIVYASQTNDKSSQSIKLFKDVLNMSPPQGFIFNQLSLTNQEIKVNAKVSSVQSLASFIEKLKEHPSIDSVSLDSINNKSSASIILIGITAKLKVEK